MMLKNKKGLEFAIGFLVTLILAVLIFSMSIYFLFKWFGGAEQLSAEVDKQTQEQIFAALRSGNQLVMIPFSVQQVDRGKWANFGIGVKNIGEEAQFRVDAHFSGTAIDPSGKPIPVGEQYIYENWLGNFAEGSEFRLRRSEDTVIPLQIRADVNTQQGVSTQKGDYIFDVCVYKMPQTAPCTLANLNKFYTGKMYQITVRVV